MSLSKGKQKYKKVFFISLILSGVFSFLVVVVCYYIYNNPSVLKSFNRTIRDKIPNKDTPPSVVLTICGRTYKVFIHGDQAVRVPKLTRVAELLTENNNQRDCHMIDANVIDGTIISDLDAGDVPYGYTRIGSVNFLIDTIHNYVAVAPYTQEDIIGPYVEGKAIDTSEMELFIVKEYLPVVFCGKTYYSQSLLIRSQNVNIVHRIAELAEWMPNTGICEDVERIADFNKHIQVNFGTHNKPLTNEYFGEVFIDIGSFIFFPRNEEILYRREDAENKGDFSSLGRINGTVSMGETREVKGDMFISRSGSESIERYVCEKTLLFPVITVKGSDIMKRFVELTDENPMFRSSFCRSALNPLEDGTMVPVEITDVLERGGEKGPYKIKKGVYTIKVGTWWSVEVDIIKNEIYELSELDSQKSYLVFGKLF